MNRYFKLSLIALLLAAVPAVAQEPVNQYVSADDGSVAMLVRFFPGVSTSDSATMEVAQGGDITFLVETAAYTGFECPVSGDLGGIIDTTNAACNTAGEIVDIINATAASFSTGFFRAVLVDAMRADAVADYLTAGAAETTRIDGLPIYYDTSANFAVGESRALLPGSCRTDISCFVTSAGNLIENPLAGTRSTLTWVEGVNTYASGTSVLYIYSVKSSNKASGTESVTTLWSEAMGATTVNKQFTQFQNVPVIGRSHEKLIVRVTNSAAQASVVLLAAGNQGNP